MPEPKTDVSAVDDITIHTSDNRTLSLDFTTPLNGRTLTGTPTATVEPSGSMSTNTVAVNSAAYTDRNGDMVAASKAVTYKVSGQVEGQDYIVTIVATDSESETIVGVQHIKCRKR